MEPDKQHLSNHVIMKCKMLLWVTGLYGRVRDRSLLNCLTQDSLGVTRLLNLSGFKLLFLESFSESEKCCIRLDFFGFVSNRRSIQSIRLDILIETV